MRRLVGCAGSGGNGTGDSHPWPRSLEKPGAVPQHRHTSGFRPGLAVFSYYSGHMGDQESKW